MKINLLNRLLNDEKKTDKGLYSSGPYWDYKNRKAIYQLKKNGLENFRGLNSGVGTSYADNLIYDFRNELNLKGRVVSALFDLPLIKKIFQGQLTVTSNHINNYLKNLSIVYKNNETVKNLIKKYSFDRTVEFGCVSKFNLNNLEYSTHYINMAYRIDVLSKTFNFKNIKSFFEIGGGFGANIHFLLTNFSNIKKIIYLDTVPNIYVGSEYLKYFYGESVKNYLDTCESKKISFDNDDRLEIICIPPWQIEKLETKIDHFHNAASFVEMPEKVIRNYVSHIKKNKIRDISLISYGNHDPKTTFNPESLNNFFEGNLNIEWHENLINEYKKKLIFLTSKKN